MKVKLNNENFTSLKNGSKIYINPKNKGKFTATKKSTGKSTEELTHSKNPLTRKRAIFAQNAKKWHHKNGGNIEFIDSLITEFKKGGKLSKEYIKKAHEKPGGSNVGKKKFASGKPRTGPYVGPSGGAPKGSYPIPDLAHAKSAIKLSGHAPNPSGIKAAVYRKYPQLKKHQDGGNVTVKDSTYVSQGFLKPRIKKALKDLTKKEVKDKISDLSYKYVKIKTTTSGEFQKQMLKNNDSEIKKLRSLTPKKDNGGIIDKILQEWKK